METFLSTFKEKEARRFKLKAGVFLLIIEQNQILLLRRYQTGIEDGHYVVPMGGHDGKEPITSTLIREAKEECNITLERENIELAHVMHRLHPMPEGLSFEQIDLFFRVDSYTGELHNNEPDRCDELAFYPLDDLPKNLSPFIHHALTCVQNNIPYSEYGFGGAL